MHYIVALGAAFAALVGCALGADLSPTYAAASWNPGPRLELGGFATSPTPDKYDSAAQLAGDAPQAADQTPDGAGALENTADTDTATDPPVATDGGQVSAQPR